MSEIHGAVGSYVVNALDESELDEFEQHLAVCETCRREVIEFSETSAELSVMVATPPPPALRGSILAAIREVRPLPPELPTPVREEEGPAPRRALLAAVPDADRTSAVTATGTPAAEPVVDELAQRRQHRRTRVLTLAVAAAMVIALALGGWVVTLVQQRQTQVADGNLETQVLSAPDAKIYKTTMKNGAKVSFVVSKSLDKAMFVGNDLPDPGAGKTYQLLTLDSAEKAAPDATLDGGAQKKWFTGPVGSSASLAVTIEPAGGSQQPTFPIQAVTSL